MGFVVTGKMGRVTGCRICNDVIAMIERRARGPVVIGNADVRWMYGREKYTGKIDRFFSSSIRNNLLMETVF